MNRTVCGSKTMMNYYQNSEIFIHTTNIYVMSSETVSHVMPRNESGTLIFSLNLKQWWFCFKIK